MVNSMLDLEIGVKQISQFAKNRKFQLTKMDQSLIKVMWLPPPPHLTGPQVN